MLWPGGSADGRIVSTNRSKSQQSNASASLKGKGGTRMNAGRGDRASPGQGASDDDDDGPRNGASGKAPAAAARIAPTTDALPALLTDPIPPDCREGGRMSLEERSLNRLIERIPETLKTLRRLCTTLETAPAAAKEAERAVGRPSATVSPPPILVAGKRSSTTSPTSTAAAAAPGAPSGTSPAHPPAAAAAPADESAEEVGRILESVRLLEALLFPIPVLYAARPFALPLTPRPVTRKKKAAAARRKKGGKRADAAGAAESAALALYDPLLHRVTAKRRKAAWKAFLHKSSNAFSLIIGAARSEGVLERPHLCAALLTFLYNVLRNIPGTEKESSADKGRKAVRLCERVGLVKMLGSIMQRYHAELRRVERRTFVVEELRDAESAADRKLRDAGLVDRFQCLRVIEAAMLLYAEAAKGNVKINTMLRLSKDLRRAVDGAQYVAIACVLRSLQSYAKLSDFGCLPVAQVMRSCQAGSADKADGAVASSVKEAIAKNRATALKGLRQLSRETSFGLSVLSHLLTAIFLGTKTSLAAQEVGSVGVNLCVRIIEGLANFLYVTLHKVRRVLVTASGTEKAPLREPVWVLVFKRKLEMALFWSITVLQRVCENDKKNKFTEELHVRNHVLAHLLLILKSSGRQPSDGGAVMTADGELADSEGKLEWCTEQRRRSGSGGSPYVGNSSFSGGAFDVDERTLGGSFGHGAGSDAAAGAMMTENEEMTLAVMASIKVMLSLDRAKALEELGRVCGGLAGVVREVVGFRSDAPEQWHRYYMMLAAMYGVRQVPSAPGESGYTLDCRLPPHLLLLPPTVTEEELSARSFSLRTLSPTAGTQASRSSSLQRKVPELGGATDAASGGTVDMASQQCSRSATPESPAHSSTQQLPGVCSLGDLAASEERRSAEQKPLLPTLPRATSDLLLVDRHPGWLSPELGLDADCAEPELAPETLLSTWAAAPLRSGKPWPFTDPGLPPTNFIRGHQNEVGAPQPLCGPTRAQRIAVLRQQIARMAQLSEEANDLDTNTMNHHRYNIVYERDDAKALVEGGGGDGADAGGAEAGCPQEDVLRFRANFESGNLKRAIKVSNREYDLVMNWDTSSNSFTQWFCFSVEGYEPGATYRFNILNMEKGSSAFNEGQRPLMLFVPRVKAAQTSGSPAALPDWQRVGKDIYYYRNPYGRPDRVSMRGKPYPLYTTTGGDGDARVDLSRAVRRTGAATRRTRSISNSGAVNRSRHASPSPPTASLGGRGGRGGGAFVRRSLRAQAATAAAGSGCSAARQTHSRSRSPAQRSTSQARKPAAAAGGSSAAAMPTLPKAPISNADFPADMFTLTFSVSMPTEEGTVYLANCFPYTYTEMLNHLDVLSGPSSRDAAEGAGEAEKDDTWRYVAVQTLCTTLGGLPVPIITVTARERERGGGPYSSEEIASRPVCVMTARIHPGETNSSWMMHGILEALLRSHVAGTAGGIAEEHHPAGDAVIRQLLHSHVFKIIPMLNPDGVVMGNHRCSIAGVDLNRDYLRPDPEVNPTIYSVHRYLRHVIDVEERAVVLFADFHGHSKAKNYLVYGCTERLADVLTRAIAKDRAKKKGVAEEAEASADRSLPLLSSSSAQPSSPHTRPLAATGGESSPAGGGGGDEEAAGSADRVVDIAYEKLFPILLDHLSPSFGLSQCSFSMQKAMRKTGRILQYRKYGIRMSYTVEGTMAGGRAADFVCPWGFPAGRPSSERDSADLPETHYTQDSYSAMGHSFLSAFHLLATIHATLTIGDDEDRPSCLERVPAGLLSTAWEQLEASGTGRGAPVASTSSPLVIPLAEDEATGNGLLSTRTAVAGSYVMATRQARRTCATPPPSSFSTPPSADAPLQPSSTMAPSPSSGFPFSTAAMDRLLSRYRAAVQYLFVSSPSRLADEGERDSDTDGEDGDSDGGPRITQIGKRRAKGGKKKAAAKAKTVKTAAAEGGATAPPTSAPSPTPGDDDDADEDPYSGPDGADSEMPQSPMSADFDASSPTSIAAATLPPGSPLALDDDDDGTDEKYVISLSDTDESDDDEEEEEDDDDAPDTTDAVTAGQHGSDDDDDENGDDDGSVSESDDDDDDADYGDVDPMPSGLFSYQ